MAEAERTGRGIALETLTGIRERARLRRPQRTMLHSWPFAQLGSFIAYKAKKAGVPVVYVDPAYTSQERSQCHHTARHNRPSQAVFSCRVCGFVDHADHNASHNIPPARLDGVGLRGPVNGPRTHPHHASPGRSRTHHSQ
ncbi:zinc ribbon domain-containing protein [Streptomyces sp. NPDC059262]|uniref:zinc ribbon domain-containing protein n=1 Tax=Streptomyces sp. NPDC059262 TaxID=3346797 RepID=UPI003690AF98